MEFKDFNKDKLVETIIETGSFTECAARQIVERNEEEIATAEALEELLPDYLIDMSEKDVYSILAKRYDDAYTELDDKEYQETGHQDTDEELENGDWLCVRP